VHEIVGLKVVEVMRIIVAVVVEVTYIVGYRVSWWEIEGSDCSVSW